MKRTFLKTITALCIVVMMFGMSAFAAPQKMSDGGIFDPQFYAQTYPDVTAAFGTDTNALYRHYKIYGQKEGRLPYDPAALAENGSQPTIISVKQYDTGWVPYGATPRIQNTLRSSLNGDVITLQTRSDGTVIMTESANSRTLDIFTPISPLKKENGEALSGQFYINSPLPMASVVQVLCVDDGFITIYVYGLTESTGCDAMIIFFEQNKQ